MRELLKYFIVIGLILWISSLLWLMVSCEKDTRPYYIIRTDVHEFRTREVIEINNGIKFYSENSMDTIEVHGSYIKKYIRPEVKEINHNNYSK